MSCPCATTFSYWWRAAGNVTVAGIARVSGGLPIRYVVNTNADGDLVGGNEVVAAAGRRQFPQATRRTECLHRGARNVLNAMVTPGAAIDLVHSASVTGEIEALNTLIDVVPVGDVHRGWHVGRAWNTAESRLTESP